MATPPSAGTIARSKLRQWALDAIQLYESNAANEFVVYGNVNDDIVVPTTAPRLGGLTDFLLQVLLPRFDVVLSYDIGNGIRVEKGGDIFSRWPQIKENPDLPRAPRSAVETLTHYFRYTANLARLGGDRAQVGWIIRSAGLLAPSLQGGFEYDLNALDSLIRDWSSEALLAGHTLATFLITENLNDLHPLVVNNPRAARIKIALPSPDDLAQAFEFLKPNFTCALREFSGQLQTVAQQLAGSTLGAIETLLKTREHSQQEVQPADLVQLKKQLVEKDCNGLIEFIESKRTLDDIYGQEKVKTWLRQDIALWQQSDLAAMPKGYLLCGPVGTGKTFMVECLAGEARVPVVKLKNFRDKWVGSTEGNLERIF